MFSPVWAFQVVGKFFESLTPLPVGPRHCGQLSFANANAAKASSAREQAAYRNFGRAAIRFNILLPKISAARAVTESGASCPINRPNSRWFRGKSPGGCKDNLAESRTRNRRPSRLLAR